MERSRLFRIESLQFPSTPQLKQGNCGSRAMPLHQILALFDITRSIWYSSVQRGPPTEGVGGARSTYMKTEPGA